MKQMIEVLRFSLDGFTPKEQTFHLGILLELKKPPSLVGLSTAMRERIMQRHYESLPILEKYNYEDWRLGVWGFLGGLPEPHWVDLELNHLKGDDRRTRQLFTASIPFEAVVYSPYGMIPTPYQAFDLRGKLGNGEPCYIPQRSLNLLKDIRGSQQNCNTKGLTP